MPTHERIDPGPRVPFDQTELVQRLDHAVFGVDNETGLLHHVRVIEEKMDRLTITIVGSALSLTVGILSVAATIIITAQ